MPIVHMLADDRVGANRAVLVHLKNVMILKSWGEVPLYKITSSNFMVSKKLRKGARFRTTSTIFMFFYQHHHHDHNLFQENLRHVHVVEEVDQLLAARWSVVLASLKKNFSGLEVSKICLKKGIPSLRPFSQEVSRESSG